MSLSQYIENQDIEESSFHTDSNLTIQKTNCTFVI